MQIEKRWRDSSLFLIDFLSMIDTQALLIKIIPPNDRDHREGFNNKPYIDILNGDEKCFLEDALITQLQTKAFDALVVETLAYLKSEKAVVHLREMLRNMEDAMSKLKVATSIFEIEDDSLMIGVALLQFEKLEREESPYQIYSLITAFYHLSKFNDADTNAAIGKYLKHKEYLLAYNAKRFFKDMGKQDRKQSTPANSKQEDQRPVEVIFARLDASHQNQTNQLLHYIFVPLMVLGILGMAWALPFPEIGFLKAYKGYFNWASFVIAIAVYYYLKQSPMLSYLMLFLMFGFSYIIMQFEIWEKAGGPALGLISVGILMLSLLGQYIGGKIEGKEQSFNDDSKLFYVTPLWVMYRLARKIKLKY